MTKTSLVLSLAGIAVAGATGGYLLSYWLSRPNESIAGAPELVFAHIANPRIASQSNQSASNYAALVSGLHALRARPNTPSASVLVLSGELVTRRVGSAASRDSSPTKQTGDSIVGFAALARALAQSPVQEIYLVADDTIPSDSLLRIRMAADSVGLRIHDVKACSQQGDGAPRTCDVGSRYRMLAIPPFPTNRAVARVLVDSTDSLVSRAEREERRIILFPSSAPGVDSASSSLASAWRHVVTRPGVAAILGREGSESSVPMSKFPTTPSLGATALGPHPTRGVTVTSIRGREVSTDTLLYDEGFRSHLLTRRFRESEPGFFSLSNVASSLGEPARSTIFWIAVLTAFLTVAALWKVPARGESSSSVSDKVASATTTTSSATRAGATTTVTSSTSSDGSSVFQTNLGRTVLSGLTGIAAITILKDVLGISGPSGQFWFTVVFILAFFAILILMSVLRAVAEGMRDSIVNPDPGPPVGAPAQNGWWSRWKRRWASTRTRRLVRLDTWSKVFFGQPFDQTVVWESRYTKLQDSLLASVDRVREQISDAVGNALREKGFAGVQAERDYRVNVSLLGTDLQSTFYISAARDSLAKEFSKCSVAYVAIGAGEARWWKASYQDGLEMARSSARLRRRSPHAGPPRITDRLTDIDIVDQSQNVTALQDDKIALSATRADGVSVSVKSTPEPSVEKLLSLLSDPTVFGGGSQPANAMISDEGHIVLIPTSPGATKLAIQSFSLGGATLGTFSKLSPDDTVLLKNPPPFFGVAGPLKLRDYFQLRGVLDYEAFIIIPIPFADRAIKNGDRRAGIHISFSKALYLESLWGPLDHIRQDPAGDKLVPNFQSNGQILGFLLKDPTLKAVLTQAVRVIGELIQQISDEWYKRRPTR